MIQFLFILIISLIVIKTLIDNNNINNTQISNNNISLIQQKKTHYNIDNNIDKNNNILPWSRILNTNQSLKIYCIKIKIPSLNDYENWKELVNDLNFNPQTEEIEIQSENESKALAIANLIYSNFAGQISLVNIIEKNLLNISINKAQQYKLVSIKLKEQLIEKLYNNNNNVSSNIFNRDLANNSLNRDLSNKDLSNNLFINENTDLSNNDIEAYQGGDYAYI